MACSQLTMTLLLYLPTFILSFTVVLVCGLLEWKHISGFFSIIWLYLFPLEGQLLITNLFNIARFIWLSQAKTWISRSHYMALYCYALWLELSWEVVVCFVDIGGLVDRHFFSKNLKIENDYSEVETSKIPFRFV